MTPFMRAALPAAAAFMAACSPEPAREPANETAPAASETATGSNAGASPPSASPSAPQAHPCRVQDGKPVEAVNIRAIGTEPFWGARTDGRCVTYSTPEDQAGTRVWAKGQFGPDGTVWKGALRGKAFELTVRPMRDCSDGMSDNRYPLEARLLVDGEERRGCAEPAATGR